MGPQRKRTKKRGKRGSEKNTKERQKEGKKFGLLNDVGNRPGRTLDTAMGKTETKPRKAREKRGKKTDGPNEPRGKDREKPRPSAWINEKKGCPDLKRVKGNRERRSGGKGKKKVVKKVLGGKSKTTKGNQKLREKPENQTGGF